MLRTLGVTFPLFALGVMLGSPLTGQPREYKKVAIGEIMEGHVPDGELIETTGYLWVSSTGVFLNVNPPSARWPLFIDVVNVPLDMFAKVQTACTSERPSLDAGCQAVVHGRAGRAIERDGRRAIFASSIAQLP